MVLRNHPSLFAMQLTAAAVLASLSLVAASPLARRDTSVAFQGKTYVNKGLVGFGRISSELRDSFGETLGGLGSAIALESFDTDADGKASFSILMQPDRGHNTQVTTDYRARHHRFSGTFDAAATGPAENVALTYEDTQLYRIADPKFALNYTTGLDPTGSRAPLLQRNILLPIAAPNNHVSFDTEGLAIDRRGFYYVSDEYGANVYVVEQHSGLVINTITPPAAVIPRIGGKANFTSETVPDTGRAPNQGLEGLTLDQSQGGLLWGLMQSALVQDSAKASKETNRYARLFGWDVSNPLRARLVHEYVVPLPQSKKLKTRASSELHIVDAQTFLVLARDGNGFGDTSSDSSYKQADLISTVGATDIAGSKYDQPENAVAPGGVLNADVKPTAYQSFVDLVNKKELAKFGLQTGGAFDRTLIASKLESLALAKLPDSDDSLLFVVSDSDFITKNGFQAAEQRRGQYVVAPYSDPYAEQYGNADTQVFIYRLTLPGYSQPGVN